MENRCGFQLLSEAPAVTTRLLLPASSVCLGRNGLEFRSASPIALWTEMTVGLESSAGSQKLHCAGVVVACSGSRPAGYLISLLFMTLSRQSEEALISFGVR
jgi:hypothetical protein